MKYTSEECPTNAGDVPHLTNNQLIALTVLDVLVLAATVVSNALVIFLLLKTKQISNVSCKLIFHLSVSDLLIALLVETLFIVVIFKTNCAVKATSQFIAAFLARLSAYTIALIGIDRFLRIKYKMTFRTILTAKSVMLMIVLVWVLALTNAVITTFGILINKRVAQTISSSLDWMILIFVVFLQLLTIRVVKKINGRDGHPTPAIVQRTQNKITSMCMGIMLLLVIFMVPYVVMQIVRNKIREDLDVHGKSVLEFTFRISILLGYSNSFANATLFLIKNVKCRRFLKAALSKKMHTSSNFDTQQHIQSSNQEQNVRTRGP